MGTLNAHIKKAILNNYHFVDLVMNLEIRGLPPQWNKTDLFRIVVFSVVGPSELEGPTTVVGAP